MKKIFVAFLLSAIVFSGCTIKFGVTNDTNDTNDTNEEKEIKEVKETTEVKKTEEVKSFIDLISPPNETPFDSSPIVIQGKVSTNAKKIEVKAIGGQKGYCDVLCAPYYEDIYTLDSFKPGDQTFSYGARSDWNNLAHGYNNYTFTAYFNDESTASDSVTLYYDPSKIQYGDNSYGPIAEVSDAVAAFAGITDANAYINDNFDNKYIKGVLLSGETSRFWAVKQDSNWKILALAKPNEEVSCTVFAPYNFPAALSKDCRK
ncbi:MAG: hypothetical protein Q8P62_03945 [Candidatus Peregrinibacteria bacterium]|nr:hypothetical protein [Candidatus Peregrinibacteria bacterium]